MATIHAPTGLVATPYVILNAFSTSSNTPIDLSIKGFFNENEFTCDESPCALQTAESGRIVFRASTSTGVESDEVSAEIQVKQRDGGYEVKITRQAGFVYFQDKCAAVWQTPSTELPYWATFPQDPSQLNTNKDLYNLSANLMRNGIVDTKSCPNGGWLGSGPNACALDLLRPEMTRWQNQYDLSIWTSGRDNGIPPVLLKTLIEVESQFWPITRRQQLDELGLAQINQLGIDVLLRTDPDFYQKTCSTALYDCTLPYASQPPINQQLLRGTIAKSLDAECPTCKYGLNLDAAGNSVGLIGKVLYANCVHTNKLLGPKKNSLTYEDAWKLTLATYHSGWGCVQYAISKTIEDKQDVTWDNVANHFECPTARPYVEKFFAALYEFDNNLATDLNLQLVTPSVKAPPASSPTTSTAVVVVSVFLDSNFDGQMQPNEVINNLPVEMTLTTGETISKNTRDGSAIFDLSGVPIGIGATFKLPTIYKNTTIVVPQSGTIPIKFVMSQPVNTTPTP